MASSTTHFTFSIDLHVQSKLLALTLIVVQLQKIEVQNNALECACVWLQLIIFSTQITTHLLLVYMGRETHFN